MPTAVEALIETLDLDALPDDRFVGHSPKVDWYRVFGGQVVAQALMAAQRTIDGTPAHSLHAYFMRPGDPAEPITYEVERIRDGKSFTTRRVVASQNGKAIFSMSASFHENEAGFEHQEDMPDVPPPDALPSAAEMRERLLLTEVPDHIRRYLMRDRPIELRPVHPRNYLALEPGEPVQNIWFRADGSLPALPALHQCVLAYASDYALVDTALIPHASSIFDRSVMVASLDHALWFHRPVRLDEWLLYAQTSPVASGGRGLTRASIFSADGVLVASSIQEGLMRKRTRRSD